MKLCPICQSSYEDAVDFCFKDGAPLESTEAAAPAEDHRTGFAGLSADDLEPPDAISLSNIPAVDVDDEAVTQTLPIDLPDAEEYDRITTSGALEPVSDPIDRDVTGIVDPFGGHEEEAFRARLAETDGPAPAVEDVDETLQDEEESDDAAAAPVPAKAATPAKAAPKPAGKSGRRPRTKPSSAGGAPPKTRPRKRPEDFGKRESSDNRGLFMFVGLVALLLIAFIGWQAMKKPSGETIAHSGQPPAPTDVRADEPEATPAPEITFEDEPTPDPEAELAEGDSAPSEGDEDVASEDGETPGEDEPETADEVEEPTSEPVAVADPAAERRAEEARAAREARRLELEEERRRRAAESTPEPTPAPVADGPPDPPFNSGGTDEPVTAADNPWGGTTTVEATPAPAGDASNPWGTTAAAESRVTITTRPPGARVTVGGRYRGQAPVSLTLAPGNHEVRVEQQGFATQTRYTKVEGSAPISLDVVLEPLERVAQGTLMVASAPPAMLFIDGVAKGRTPISVAISAGNHRFRLEAEGSPALEQNVTVQLTEGQTVNKFFQIPPD